MIHGSLTIVAAPGQREGVLQALRSLVGPTRVEPGCLRCHLHEDVEEAGSFTLVEDWATQADFERRLRSEPYRRLLLIMELSAKMPEIRFQVVASTMGMEVIQAARGH
jgi:quinol monooxygenase YgiN